VKKRPGLERPALDPEPDVPEPSSSLKEFHKVAIVPAKDEAGTVGEVVKSLLQTPVDEVIVVANGCTDDTVEAAIGAGAKILNIVTPLGHDVGRAIGAAAVDADIYLFTDADFVLPPSTFVPFLNAVADGVDVALNDLDSIATRRARTHVVNVCKRFLNTAMGLEHLGINSMTAIPHALSRRAIDAIGPENLAVPPKAMALARLAGLHIEAVSSINVNSRNRVRPRVHGPGLGPIDQLIIGDHLEALYELVRAGGPRGRYPDVNRDRERLSRCSLLEFVRLQRAL